MIRKYLMALATVLIAGTSAQAGLLIDPSGGTTLWDSTNNHDDEVMSRNLGFAFNYYGQTLSSIYVSTNGNLNTIGTSEYDNTGFPNGAVQGMIAPLWDDLYIYQGSGQSITEKAVAGSSYSVTWDVSEFSNMAPRFTFQATLIGVSQMIGGFRYLAGDIVFSYSLLTPSFAGGSATIGLNTATSATPLPGTTDGVVFDSTVSSYFGTHDAVLFRPDGRGGYNATLMTLGAQSVPEPAGLVMLGLGAAGVGCALGRRRRTVR